MARNKNDGKGRMGGRAKGTPNRVTSSVREWVSTLVYKNRRQIERDLKALEPKERIAAIEKLMAYVIPKQQAVSASVELENLSESQLDILIDEITQNIEPTNEVEDGENTD